MKARVKIAKGSIIFSSDRARILFLEQNDGKDAILEIDDAPTANARRYFEGALVPAIFYQHPTSGWSNFAEAREAIKLEFLPAWGKTMKGDRIKMARSTTELSKENFFKLIDSITRWLTENQYEVPNPDDYKAWRDSAPSTGEVYPPLARLKEVYDKAKEATLPPWRIKH